MAFDDDDNPAAEPSAQTPDGGPTAEDALEDGIPDYKLFSAMFSKKKVSSKVIRKGEKDFESHGTQAQDNTLEASRQALEEVLSYTRIHRPENWIRAWYFPDWWTQQRPEGSRDDALLHERVVAVEQERGSWMRDIGRVVSGSKDQPGVGRLWLLPEEALYLIERGNVDIWWPDKEFGELLPPGVGNGPGRNQFGPDDYDAGVPLTVEAAYAMMVGYESERGKTTLPKYQVYTHLKRAGFNVMRAPMHAPPPEPPAPSSSLQSLWQWLFSFVSREGKSQRGPYGPLVSPGLYRAYRPIYQQLAVIPRHKPSAHPEVHHPVQEPFRVHFHVWKPAGVPFSKKNPPPPDFRIAVADTADSKLPTLEQIEALLESTPLDLPNPEWQGPGKLYQRLKHGHRNVLVAVVDRGLVNFIRFGEAAFGAERLFERFNSRGSGARGGKKGGRGRGHGRGRGRGGGRATR
ncbi:tRNA-splicing endonuclease subunit sen54 [Metarhizium acridum]|nr:tRNA-splicing endonuclease subunit sen54 [Metarhizium acridum]